MDMNSLQFFKGKIIGISLPNSVNLTVVECEPSVKGDTATGATKMAKVETGYEVRVPLFVNEGDVLRIDTRTVTILNVLNYKNQLFLRAGFFL